MKLTTGNPRNCLGPVLGPQYDVVQPLRALPHREVAAAIETVQVPGAASVGPLTFEFLVPTEARWGEARWAEWTEIDRDGGVWTVQASSPWIKSFLRVPCGWVKLQGQMDLRERGRRWR